MLKKIITPIALVVTFILNSMSVNASTVLTSGTYKQSGAIYNRAGEILKANLPFETPPEDDTFFYFNQCYTGEVTVDINFNVKKGKNYIGTLPVGRLFTIVLSDKDGLGRMDSIIYRIDKNDGTVGDESFFYTYGKVHIGNNTARIKIDTDKEEAILYLNDNNGVKVPYSHYYSYLRCLKFGHNTDNERTTVFNSVTVTCNGTVDTYNFDSTDAETYDINTESKSTSSNPPKIKKIFATYKGHKYDVTNNNITFNQGDVVDFSFVVDWAGCTKGAVSLDQNVNGSSRQYMLSNNKAEEIKALKLSDHFKSGEPIYATIYNFDNHESSSIKTKINLSPSNGTASYDKSINLKTEEITIPSDVAIFGDSEVTLEPGEIPVSVEASKDKIRFVYGQNVPKENNSDDESKFKNFDYNEYKNEIDNLKDKADKLNKVLKEQSDKIKKGEKISSQEKKEKQNLYKSFQDGFKKLKKNHTNKIPLNSWKNVSAECEAGGYLELNKVNNTWSEAAGYIIINAKVTYKHDNTIFVGYVPVCYNISGSIDATGSLNVTVGNISTDINNMSTSVEGMLSVEIGASAGAGVGVSGIADAMVKGDGSLVVNATFPDSHIRIIISAKASFEIETMGQVLYSLTYPVLSDKLIYETGMEKPKNDKPDYSMNYCVDPNNHYLGTARNYLDFDSEWLGAYPHLAPMALDYSPVTTELLGTNIYPNTDTAIQEINGTKVLLWIEDNPNRTDSDRTMLVYSVQNPGDSSWSNPTPVYDDGTADFYPCFKDGWVVWQNNTVKIKENATLAEIGSTCEIYAAKFNGTGFDAPIRITKNDSVDFLPVVSVNNNIATVSWVNNDANNIMMNTGITSINSIDIHNNSLAKPKCIYSGNVPIIDIDSEYYNNNYNIAYILDKDNIYATSEDRIIEVRNSGNSVILSEPALINPVFSNNRIYWYNNSNIYYAEVSNPTIIETVISGDDIILPNKFVVDTNSKGDSVILLENNGIDSNGINAILYNNNKWSEVVKLTETDTVVNHMNVHIDENSNVYASFTATDNNTNDNVENTNNELTNLYLMKLVPSYDVGVENFDIDDNDVTAGNQTSASVTVANYGYKEINNFTLNLYDTQNNLVNTKNYTDSILPGECIVVNIDYIPQGLGVKGDIKTEVKINEEEADLLNNSYIYPYGGVDVAVQNEDVLETLPENHVLANIVNNSCATAYNVLVELRKDSVDGDIISTQNIESLSYSDDYMVDFTINPNQIATSAQPVQLYITTKHNAEDLCTSNDNAIVCIGKYTAPTNNYDSFINHVNNENNANVVAINTIVNNNTMEDVTLFNTLEMKDLSGNVLNKSMHKVYVESCSSTSDDFVLQLPTGCSINDVSFDVHITDVKPMPDINKDGKLNKEDPTTLLNFISGLIPIDKIDYENSDFNDDGAVDILDVISLLNTPNASVN